MASHLVTRIPEPDHTFLSFYCTALPALMPGPQQAKFSQLIGKTAKPPARPRRAFWALCEDTRTPGNRSLRRQQLAAAKLDNKYLDFPRFTLC